MIIRNAQIYAQDGRFHPGAVRIWNGIFKEITLSGAAIHPEGREQVLDAEGQYLIPGLIDIHLHGAVGSDICDDTDEAFQKVASFESNQGVTSICAATLTLPEETLLSVLRRGAAFSQIYNGHSAYADLIGFNMEGPFINPERKGSQNEKYIRECDPVLAERFIKSSGGLVRFIGIAPEMSPDSDTFIRTFSDQTGVALAHTNADYETALVAFRAGATHVVHLFNAMPDMLHRAPGVIGAAVDTPSVDAELICDGIHVHPSAVRSAVRMFGYERIVFISDSLRPTGMPDGKYPFGGQTVEKKGRKCYLAGSDVLAGSVSTLMDCLRNAVLSIGIPLEKAVACATINPARSVHQEAMYGSIERGKRGNAVLLRKEDLHVIAVVKDGKIIRGGAG